MTTLIARECPAGDWGIWDRHLRTWLAAGYETERDAWQRLLEIDSPHPWELCLRHADQDEPGEEPDLVDCVMCDGDGTCPQCDQDCPHCEGTGKVEAG